MRYCVVLITVLLLFSACSTKVLKKYASAQSVIFEESATEDISNRCCKESLNYAPDEYHPEHNPMKYVKIVAHFIFDDEGSQKVDDKFYPDFVKMLLAKCNYRLEKNAPMFLPEGHGNPALDIPFRFVLDTEDENKGVHLHYDTGLSYFNKKMKGSTSAAKRDQFNKYGMKKDSVLNIFFLEHHPDSTRSKTYKSSSDGVSGGSWVKIAGIHRQYSKCVDKGKNDTEKNMLHCMANKYYGLTNHEIGHSLGLGHTWAHNDGCDDTPKNNKCWNHNSPRGTLCDEPSEVSNNVMDYNAWQSAFSPCQLGKVYYNMQKKGSRQRKMLDQRWCHYNPEATIIIGAGESFEWKSARDLEGDLVLEANSTLVMRCQTSIPKGGKVVVKPGAKLILNGGRLTNTCGEQWLGVELWNEGKEEGKLIVQNSGRVDSAENPVETQKNEKKKQIPH